ncbi:MAG: polysaccharide deacetylase family protein, partial [Pseudomonadota bacterium]
MPILSLPARLPCVERCGLLFAVSIALAGLSGLSAAPVQAEPADCAVRSGALGVERVVEIDTTNGPRFGNMQYKDIDFLKPGEVVLTFDDGPLRRYTLNVLNALERHCTKATFFMVGRMAVTDPALVKEIDRRGHTVATHTWSHKNLGRLSASSAEREIELGVSAISAALGKPVAPFFRFPYLSDPKRMQAHLRERDIGNFSIDIDAVDFRTRSGSVIVERIMRGLKRQGKGILLFHDIQKSTARGIGKLLDRLKRGGYKVVHIVPKSSVTTLSKYDESGMKILMKRKAKAGERPLAKRS